MTRDEALEQTILAQARLKNQAAAMRLQADKLERLADELSLAITQLLGDDEATLLDAIENRRRGISA